MQPCLGHSFDAAQKRLKMSCQDCSGTCTCAPWRSEVPPKPLAKHLSMSSRALYCCIPPGKSHCAGHTAMPSNGPVKAVCRLSPDWLWQCPALSSDTVDEMHQVPARDTSAENHKQGLEQLQARGGKRAWVCQVRQHEQASFWENPSTCRAAFS